MLKKEVIFLLVFTLFISLSGNTGALTLTDNTSTFNAFFNVTVVDPGISYSQNYSLYVGITPLAQEPTGYNVTFFLPYGMRNLSACNGNNGFRNINLTFEACTMNVAIAAGQQNITNINITATNSAFTRLIDAREYIIINVTSGNSSTTSTTILNPSGIYGFNYWINPRPYAINNSVTNATLKFVSWSQSWSKYEAWVPLYAYNTSSNRTNLASNSYADIIYADKSFFDFPTYFELMSYRLNFTIYNSTGSGNERPGSFQIKTANYDKNCQILIPLQTIKNSFTDPVSNTSYNQSIAIPTFPFGTFDVYYNGLKYNASNLTLDYGINLSYDSSEAGANTILNITVPLNFTTINLSVAFTLVSAAGSTCTPLLIESQNITGFNPVSDPPDLGESINNSYVISLKNNLTNFTLTNLLIHFVQPLNVTINITNTIKDFNLTKDLIVLWREANGTLTNRSNLFYSTLKANFNDNVPGSSSNGSNITVFFQIIDVALNSSDYNFWNPGNTSNLTLYLNSTLTFPAINEVDNASGAAGSSNSYNVTVSMSTESTLTIPTSKLDGLTPTNCPTAAACNINITIDGKEIPALNYTIGSISTKGSLSSSTHTISVSYTVPASSSSTSSSGSGTSSTTAGGGSLSVNEITQNVISTSFLATGESYKFTLDKKENHTLTVLEISNNSVKINISSNSIELELGVNEEKEVDLDDDNINDLAIKLDEIKNGVFAKFSLRKLVEGEKPVGEVTGEETGKESVISKEQVKEIANKYYLVILIAILVAIFWILKKKYK